MTNSEIILELADGKYQVVRTGYSLEVLRYGEKWRDLTGDKFVWLLVDALLEKGEAEVKSNSGSVQPVEVQIPAARIYPSGTLPNVKQPTPETRGAVFGKGRKYHE